MRGRDWQVEAGWRHRRRHKESIRRAFGYLQGNKVKLGIARDFDTTDFHVEAIDLLQNRVDCECGMALMVAIICAIERGFQYTRRW